MDLAKFKKKPILGILRGIKPEVIEPLFETIISSGLESVEITMNTEGAAGLIKKAKQYCGNRITLGAGTVLTLDSLKIALDSGATFIVTPVLIEGVAEYCMKNKIHFFPGALTPLEIYRAWNSGATMVKVFPAKVFGPEYFREIKGPFNEIELFACSGVTAENLKSYFNCGASAISFGASVFKKELLDSGDFASIGFRIKEYLNAWISCN